MVPLIGLGELTPEEFLARHWQRAPLLVRGAWPGITPPLDPDELAGLALEELCHARLVRGGGASGEPRVTEHGPFKSETLETLPERAWTLLVEGVDRVVPEAADVLERFRFLPDWRIDDLMISLAAPEGGVGAHVDSYDVFLLQALGRRRWRIGPRVEGPVAHEQPFYLDETYELGAGDMLYLPPGVPHEGVALELGMTLSIGFLAPTRRQLLGSFAELAPQTPELEERYHDEDLERPAHPAELDDAALWRMRDFLARLPLDDDAALARWLGAQVTQLGDPEACDPLDPPIALDQLRAHLERGRPLRRAEGCRMAYRAEESGALLFVQGEERRLLGALAAAAPVLCGRRELLPEDLAELLDDEEGAALLLELVNEGVFYVV